VVSFLIATPQTGVDSIFATYSLMGLPFAVVRPVAALFTAIIGGTFVNWSGQSEKPSALEDASRSCSGQLHLSFANRCVEALKFGFVEMMEDIGKWLVVGLIVAGLITVLVPDSFFAIFKDNTLLSMLLVLCISVPMYICATGSIPIAVALMRKGLTPGAALVLLMAGPACNMASILVINKVLGRRTLIVYLVSIITMAICWGCFVDFCLPAEWFQTGMLSKACCETESTSWFNIGCTIVLTLLLLNVLWRRLFHKHEHHHCCHHEEPKEEEHHCCCHHHEDS
jgi:uncharacterized membrane protein YraQ (UPF0718 family)